MGYIKPAGPADDDVIFTDDEGKVYTWGEHRAMEASLHRLEMDDAMVREARRRLDSVLLDHGFDPHPPPVELVCEFCGKMEYLLHETTCRDYEKDLAVTREAGGYQWLNDKFQVVHTTSVCVNDYEACDYFRIVQTWFPNENIKYLMRREMHGDTSYKMLPWVYNNETGAVTMIERKPE